MRWPNVALALGSVLLVLAAVEGVIRLYGTGRPPEVGSTTELVEGGRIHCPDPRVGRPYFDRLERYPGCVFYPRNNIATRNLFDVTDDGVERVRIVGIGDSLIYGYGVEHEDTFLYLLQEALNRRPDGPPIQVINAGWPGYDLDDAYRLLVEKVLLIDPDFVILGLHFNDFLEFPDEPIPDPVETGWRRFRIVDYFLYRFELKRSGDRNLQALLDSFDAEALARLTARIGAFRATLAERDVPLLVLVFPLFSDLDDYPLRGVHRQVDGVLESGGIDYVDFLTHFAGQRDEDFWVAADDQHPNEVANLVFFEAVLGPLEAWLDER